MCSGQACVKVIFDNRITSLICQYNTLHVPPQHILRRKYISISSFLKTFLKRSNSIFYYVQAYPRPLVKLEGRGQNILFGSGGNFGEEGGQLPPTYRRIANLLEILPICWKFCQFVGNFEGIPCRILVASYVCWP